MTRASRKRILASESTVVFNIPERSVSGHY
jgi:hypothetical protein